MTPKSLMLAKAEALEELASQLRRPGCDYSREAAIEMATDLRTQAASLPDVIDLDQCDWEAIKQAANESPWMPPQYTRNDWVSDLCGYLRGTLHPSGASLPEGDESRDAVKREREQIVEHLRAILIGANPKETAAIRILGHAIAVIVARSSPPAASGAADALDALAVALSLIERIGVQCADGGACHHSCTTTCFRKSGCVPLTISGLDDDWRHPLLKPLPNPPKG